MMFFFLTISSSAEGAADQEWLDAVNAERKKEQLDKVTYETFEIVMDRLEKEWFDLVCASNNLSLSRL
jgi:hypothetical protein